MGESNLGPPPGKEEVEDEIAAEAAEANAFKDGSNSQKPVHRKEPSFSRWFDEDGITPSNSSMDLETSTAEESEDFELSLLHGGGSGSVAPDPELQERHTHLSRSAYVGLNGDRVKYTPLDVESGIRTNNSRTDLETLECHPQSSISALDVIKALILILVWYTFSTCLTLYNKLLLGDHLGKFPAPLLMNTVHFGLQAILSNAIVYFQSRGSENSGAKMKWRDYFIRVVPTALGTALDVNLSNVSLVFISVTFATMCKSAAPIFLILFAFAFGLEKPSIKLVSIILIISIGVLLTVAKETEFEFWGFLFVMLAAVMSGFRWCMTQILLQEEAYGLKNPITLMSYITPVMSLVTAVLSLIMDPWQDFWKNVYFDNSRHVIRSCLLLLLGGALAFFMVLTEYVLVSVTSAVTVTIAGIIKEAVTILVAVVYFHDQFTWLKGIGLVTIIFGVCLFNLYKYQKLKNGEQIEHEGTNSTSSNGTTKYVILDDMDFQDDAT